MVEALPLFGNVRAVVLGGSLAATICGALLAEYGVDVIKVEPPVTGDPLRSVGPISNGVALRWSTTARGTRSVTCDLDTSEGADLVGQLLDTADIVCDGMGGRALERHGFDARTAAAVVVRISALGPDVELDGSLGDGLIAAAEGGLLHITGYPDGPPMRLGSDVVDHLTASYAAQAAIAGLIGRHRTGAGCVVDASSTGAVLRILEWTVPMYATDGQTRTREGNFPSAVAPIGLYIAADGEFVGLVGASDANFRRLVSAMEQPDLLTDVRFATGRLRAENSDEINAIVRSWVGSLASSEVLERCRQQGVVVAVVRGIDDLLSDEHVAARGDIISIDDPVAGRILQPAPQPHTAHHVSPLNAGSELGSSNEAIWAIEFGVDEQEFERLRQTRII